MQGAAAAALQGTHGRQHPDRAAGVGSAPGRAVSSSQGAEGSPPRGCPGGTLNRERETGHAWPFFSKPATRGHLRPPVCGGGGRGWAPRVLKRGFLCRRRGRVRLTEARQQQDCGPTARRRSEAATYCPARKPGAAPGYPDWDAEGSPLGCSSCPSPHSGLAWATHTVIHTRTHTATHTYTRT